MPSTPIQTIEARPQPVVRTLPNINDKKNLAGSLLEFLQRELSHWDADLQDRQKEGEYYLQWQEMVESGKNEEGDAHVFAEMVQQEIPALIRRVRSQTANLDDSDIDQLFSTQQTYLQLCKRFDRIKLEIMEKMEWGSGLEIY